MANRQWQAQVFTAKGSDPHTLWGETLIALMQEIGRWLSEQNQASLYIGGILYTRKKENMWSTEGSGFESDARIYQKLFDRYLTKGPEYRERGFVDGIFQLSHVKTTTRRSGQEDVNNLLDRDWHIVAFVPSGEEGFYVLGHVEADAF